MEIVALFLLVASVGIGVVAVFFTTFGTLLIFLGILLYSFLTQFSVISFQELIIVFILYLCGEVVEYICIVVGIKKFGASNLAVFGALVGGIIGGVLGLSLLGIGVIGGTLLGIFLGAFIPQWFLKRDLMKSFKAGAGGVLGRISSVVIKLIIALIMVALVAVKIVEYYLI